jgi:hypothetical protein
VFARGDDRSVLETGITESSYMRFLQQTVDDPDLPFPESAETAGTCYNQTFSRKAIERLGPMADIHKIEARRTYSLSCIV